VGYYCRLEGPRDAVMLLQRGRATPWLQRRRATQWNKPRDAVPAARPREAVVTARSHDAAAAARRLAFRVYQVQGHNSRKVKVVDEGEGHKTEGQGHTSKSRA